MSKKVLKNTIWLYLFTIVKLVVPLLILPFLTRKLSVSTYGVVSFVKAYCVYVQLIIDFGFLLSATKKIAIANGNKINIGIICGDTLVEKSILSIGTIIITSILCFIVPIFKQEPFFTLLYCLSCVTSIGVLDFLYRGIEKMEKVAVPICVAKVLSVLIVIVFVNSDKELLLIPLSEIAVNIIASILSIWFLRDEKIKIIVSNFTNWVKDLKTSGIYFLSNFATTILGAMTTLVVGVILSNQEVAFWSICMLFVSAAKAMYSPIGNSLYPYMVRSRDLKYVNKIALILSFPLMLSVLFIYLYGDNFIVFIVGEKYEQMPEIIKWFIPVLIFSFYSTLYGWPVLGAINKISETTKTTVLSGLIQLLGVYLLISSNVFSLINLAICCSCSEGCLFLFRLFLIVKYKDSLK